MADYSDAKAASTASWPPRGLQSPWLRLEPLITPAELRALHLFGLSLTSAMADPVSGRYQVMDDALLNHYIEQAVAQVEQEASLTLFPIDVEERHPWDRQEFEAWGYLRCNLKPINKIREVVIQSSDATDLYRFPNEWIEQGYLHKGQIHLIPLAAANQNGAVVSLTSAAGITFMTMFGNLTGWMAAYWTVRYQAGFPDGKLPQIVNQLVGTVAAMEVLSNLAATYATQQSMSLGIDGLSQSISNPGAQLFQPRIEMLQAKRTQLASRLKTIFGNKFFIGTI